MFAELIVALAPAFPVVAVTPTRAVDPEPLRVVVVDEITGVRVVVTVVVLMVVDAGVEVADVRSTCSRWTARARSPADCVAARAFLARAASTEVTLAIRTLSTLEVGSPGADVAAAAALGPTVRPAVTVAITMTAAAPRRMASDPFDIRPTLLGVVNSIPLTTNHPRRIPAR